MMKKKVIIDQQNDQSYTIDGVLDTLGDTINSGGSAVDFVCALTGLRRDTLMSAVSAEKIPDGQGTDAWADDAAKKIVMGETVPVGGCSLSKAYGYAETVGRCLTANGFGLKLRVLTNIQEGLLVPYGIAGECAKISMFDLFSDIRKLEAGGKIRVDDAAYPTVTHYVAKLNRHLAFSGCRWRAKIDIYGEGNDLSFEIVRSEKKRRKDVRSMVVRTKKLPSIIERLTAEGRIYFEGYTRSTIFRYTKEINEAFSARDFSGKAEIITGLGKNGEKIYGIAIDPEGSPDEGVAAERRRKRKKEIASLASEITEKGRAVIRTDSTAIYGKVKELNLYLMETGAGWEAGCIKRRDENGQFYVIADRKRLAEEALKKKKEKSLLEKAPGITETILTEGEYVIEKSSPVSAARYVKCINRYLTDKKARWRAAYIKRMEGDRLVYVLVNKEAAKAAKAPGTILERAPGIVGTILSEGEYVIEKSSATSAACYVKYINRYLEEKGAGWQTGYIMRTEKTGKTYVLVNRDSAGASGAGHKKTGKGWETRKSRESVEKAVETILADGRYTIKQAASSTVSGYTERINRYLEKQGADWRAGHTKLSDGENTVHVISDEDTVRALKAENSGKRSEKRSREKAAEIAKAVIASGRYVLNTRSVGTACSYINQINRYLKEQGADLRVDYIKQEDEAGPIYVVMDSCAVQASGLKRQTKRIAKKAKKRNEDIIKAVLTKGEYVSAAHDSKTIYAHIRHLNRYLEEQGADWRADYVKQTGEDGPVYIITKAEDTGKRAALHKAVSITSAINSGEEYVLGKGDPKTAGSYVRIVNDYLADKGENWRAAYIVRYGTDAPVYAIAKKEAVYDVASGIADAVDAGGTYDIEPYNYHVAKNRQEIVNNYLADKNADWRVDLVFGKKEKRKTAALIRAEKDESVHCGKNDNETVQTKTDAPERGGSKTVRIVDGITSAAASGKEYVLDAECSESTAYRYRKLAEARLRENGTDCHIKVVAERGKNGGRYVYTMESSRDGLIEEMISKIGRDGGYPMEKYSVATIWKFMNSINARLSERGLDWRVKMASTKTDTGRTYSLVVR